MRFIIFALLLSAGCASTAPPAYEALIAALDAGEEVDVAALRNAFLAAPGHSARLAKLAELEGQALRFLDEEPLKAGPVATAILDAYRGSMAGHYALTRFYAYVDRADAATGHQRWVERLRRHLEQNHDGSEEAPYPVMSQAEALAYLRATERQPAGLIYRSSAERPLTMLVAAKPADGPMQNVHFDMMAMYRAAVAGAGQRAPGQGFQPGALIGLLARRDDAGAQAAVGALLAAEDRLDEAIDWLTAATRTGNVIANLMLADAYLANARRLADGPARVNVLARVRQNLLQAISAGSDEAMLRLAELYLNELYDEQDVAKGLPLLEQAVALNNPNASLYLAQLYLFGETVQQDYAAAEAQFLRAAGLGHQRAKVLYGRFLLSEANERTFNGQAYKWLRELAAEEDVCGTDAERGQVQTPCPAAEARLMLGELHARGVFVGSSHRRARRWFKRAVAAAPDDVRIVNEVAWWLTVTQIEKLQDERYALKIMDRVMHGDAAARRQPAYLDTWAAAHAANGNFDRAVALQQEALHEANAQAQQPAILQELQQHLTAFQAGETITDPAVP